MTSVIGSPIGIPCAVDCQPPGLADVVTQTHHVVWLAQGRSDSIDNMVALCPNCHCKMHVLDVAMDREKLLSMALQLFTVASAHGTPTR
jgi:hypothetical protein